MNKFSSAIARAYEVNGPQFQTGKLEVEFRFGTYDPSRGNIDSSGKYLHSITRRDYDVLVAGIVGKGYDLTITKYNTETCRSKDNKNLVYRITTDSNGAKEYISKTRLSLDNKEAKALFIPEYGGWLVASIEENVDPSAMPTGEWSKRTIHRRSYSTNSAQIDLSMITYPDGKVKYELEVEALIFNGNIKQSAIAAAKQIDYMYRTMWNSALPYTEGQRSSFIDFLSNRIGTASIASLPRPRELLWKDLTYGGIMRKEHTYHVAVKLDGESCLLVVKGTTSSTIKKEVWLYSHNILSLLDTAFTGYSEDMVLFGEMYGPSFFAIDRLFPELKDDYSAIVYGDSLGILINELNARSYAYGFYQRSADEIDNLTKFYQVSMPSMLQLMDNFEVDISSGDASESYKYKVPTDGLVFIPNVSGWEQRMAGSLKWKDTSKLSVDLSVLWKPAPYGREDLELTYLRSNKDANHVVFPGRVELSKLSDFLGSEVNSVTIPTGSIIEFTSEGVDENDKIILKPLKLRTDKSVPNLERRVRNILRLMRNNIPVSTLLGNNLLLMRKYHNRIKRDQYAKDTGKILVDLGSGRGGDISKWKLYDKVYAIEPDPKNFTELVKRLSLRVNEKPVVVPLQLSAFNTAGIYNSIPENIDTLSIMLSASFFWIGSPSEGRNATQGYQQFLNTIRMLMNKGLKRILIFTIDGYAVRFAMNNPFSSSMLETSMSGENPDIIDSDTLKTPEALVYLKYYPEELRLFVRLGEETILGSEGQVEGLVFMNDLIRDAGLNLISTNRANKEVFLNTAERRFTSLFSSYILETPITEYTVIPTTSVAEALLLAVNYDLYKKLSNNSLLLDSSKYPIIANVLGIMLVVDDKIYNRAGKFVVIIQGGKLVVGIRGSDYQMLLPK
jgi:hypothetical protein